MVEALAALGLVTGLRFTWMQWVPLLTLWVMMAGAIFFHFRANKPKTAFPAFFLLTLLSIAIVTI